MTATELYDTYKINKGLREHMYRVASVGWMICDAWQGEESISKEAIVSAALVHDLGNLIKSDPAKLPELFEPEGVGYWNQVKEELIKKYGAEVHKATEDMVQELNLSKETMHAFGGVGSEAMERLVQSSTYTEKISQYIDMRVGLYGIVSLEERFDDMMKRYVDTGKGDREEMLWRKQHVCAFEKEIFSHTSITPEDITDAATADIQAQLPGWEVV